jgi:pimeloyl-ACP methyl ester carboxylesterase
MPLTDNRKYKKENSMKVFTCFIAIIALLLLSPLTSLAYIDNKECSTEKPLNVHSNWQVFCVEVEDQSGKTIELRAGYLQESKAPKGNILYLEGLADSMFNHEQLFTALMKEGYRVIAFDYPGQGGPGPGQGGSQGNMNYTRIVEAKVDNLFREILISQMANAVWKELKNRKTVEPNETIDAVLGWSTGGLAAYDMVRSLNGERKTFAWGKVDTVVLIAPGIHTKTVIVISNKTLTYNWKDPKIHVEGIKPTSPGWIPLFAANLIWTARQSQEWKIADSNVRGLVLVSGPNDSYVDGRETINTICNNARKFEVVEYKNALHEIDNETSDNRTRDGMLIEQRIVEFLAGESGKSDCPE